jgi:hypothetical protein
LGVSESGGVGFLERDQSAAELEQREVVLVFLRPADQERSVSVQPGVAGFDDPAAGTPARGAELLLDLFAARADVRCELARADELTHDRVVEGAVEAQSLRSALARLGPRDRDRVEGRF